MRKTVGRSKYVIFLLVSVHESQVHPAGIPRNFTRSQLALPLYALPQTALGTRMLSLLRSELNTTGLVFFEFTAAARMSRVKYKNQYGRLLRVGFSNNI